MLYGGMEELRFRDRFTPLVKILVIWLRNQALVAACIFESWRVSVLLGQSKVTVELFNPQMPQGSISKEVFSCVIQEEVRIRIVWILFNVGIRPWSSRASVWNEFRRSPDNWAS